MNSTDRFTRGFPFVVAVPVLVLFAGLSSGCATAQPMQSSRSVPASEGTAMATAGDNGNTNLAIRVKHLAPPSRLSADATIYVVWIAPRGAAPQNVGALVLDDNLEGHLDAVTAQRTFEMMVTPEPSAQVTRPTHDAVFRSQIDRRD